MYGGSGRIADLVNDPVEVVIALKTDVTAAFFHNSR